MLRAVAGGGTLQSKCGVGAFLPLSLPLSVFQVWVGSPERATAPREKPSPLPVLLSLLFPKPSRVASFWPRQSARGKLSGSVLGAVYTVERNARWTCFEWVRKQKGRGRQV